MSEYDDLLPDEIESGTGPSDTQPSGEAGDLGVTAGAGLGDDVPAPPLSEPDEEIPPTPEEARILGQPSLHERRQAAFRTMLADPERKARYDAAQDEIMSHPAVAAFAQEEDRRFKEKQATQAAFVKAWKEKNKK